MCVFFISPLCFFGEIFAYLQKEFRSLMLSYCASSRLLSLESRILMLFCVREILGKLVALLCSTLHTLSREIVAVRQMQLTNSFVNGNLVLTTIVITIYILPNKMWIIQNISNVCCCCWYLHTSISHCILGCWRASPLCARVLCFFGAVAIDRKSNV